MMKIKIISPSLILLTSLIWFSPRPVDSASLDPQLLAEQVEIRRDTYGVPHILGKTEEAASFGLGYAQAEDHAVEIARRFISGRGETAKYFGTNFEGDLIVRRFDNISASREGFKTLSPLFQRIVTAYVAGVNHYIAKNRGKLPAWIPTFEPVDVLANARAGNLRSLVDQPTIRALREKYEGKPQSTASLGRAPDDEDDEAAAWAAEAGSNALAIGGSRTTSGRPILLGNPHLNWSSLYWEAQVTVPGVINFFGSTLVGIPVLRAGFNDHLGWVTTNNRPDLEDIYALKLDPAKPDHYLFNGLSKPLRKHDVSVEVKSQDQMMRTETRSYWDSDLGPVIYRNATQAFAVRSTMSDAFRYFEGFYRLSKTRNLSEWLAVMKMRLVPTSNFTYADAAGNILYQWNGQVPQRVDDGMNYELDVPAETGKYVWKTLHPLADFPRLLNPRGGYIQNCNNPPWFTSLRDTLDPKKYPTYFERGELALRPQVALDMLESQPKFSFDDVRRLKYNTKMLLADRVKPDLIAAIKQTIATALNVDEDLRRGLAVLESWDNQTAASSRGGVLFQRFWDQYRTAVKQPFARPWDERDPARTPSGLSDPTAAVKHFAEAVKWTRQTYGAQDVAWGDVHRFRFKDVDLPADGAMGTYGLFRVMGFNQRPDGKRIAGWTSNDDPLTGFGDGWVLAVEFTKPLTAYSVLAYGQTTDSNSPHSRDQIGLFAAHSYKRVWFREAEIKANLKRSYRP